MIAMTRQLLLLWGWARDLLCFDVCGLPLQIWAFVEVAEVEGCKVGCLFLAELWLGYLLWVAVEELLGVRMA